MTSSSHRPKSGARSKRVSLDLATVQIKCSFCRNSFYARPESAVCPKCERPANRDLPILWRVLSIVVPLLGLGYALSIRPHSPVAARQGFKWALVGSALIFGAFVLSRGF